MFSKHGTRHGNLNQDACWYGTAVYGTAGETLFVAAAFDGHGLLGEQAASAAVRGLQKVCDEPEGLSGFGDGERDTTEDAMAVLFARVNQAVLAEHEVPPEEYVAGFHLLPIMRVKCGVHHLSHCLFISVWV